jgi:queuosine precursor transporter
MNEYIFCLQTVSIALSLLLCLHYGKQLLQTYICLLVILANLFIVKQINLGEYNATATDALSVGAFLGINLMQEYFGKEAARNTIIVSFICGLLYTILSLFHLWYTPSAFDFSQNAYELLLKPMPRILVSSLITCASAEYIDYLLFGIIKRWVPLLFFLRMSASLIISQFLDTIIFTYLALYGSHAQLWEIITISYLIKLTTIAISTPFITLSLYYIPLRKMPC